MFEWRRVFDDGVQIPNSAMCTKGPPRIGREGKFEDLEPPAGEARDKVLPELLVRHTINAP